MKLNTLLKPWVSIPETVVDPTGRAVALQRDIARAYGCADSTIRHICKKQHIRKFAGKFLDIEDISNALANRKPVGRPRKEAA
jgi:hypothetical protein